MAYIPFDNANPDGSAQDGVALAESIKQNQDALRDSIIAGAMIGWDMAITVGSGSAANPEFFEYSNGVYRIRKTFVWNADGDPATVLYEFSSNSGGAYDTMKTATFNYDASQNLTGVTWS